MLHLRLNQTLTGGMEDPVWFRTGKDLSVCLLFGFSFPYIPLLLSPLFKMSKANSVKWWYLNTGIKTETHCLLKKKGLKWSPEEFGKYGVPYNKQASSDFNSMVRYLGFKTFCHFVVVFCLMTQMLWRGLSGWAHAVTFTWNNWTLLYLILPT